MRTQTQQDGITLLVTLLLMGILLGISTSLLTITIKQFQLSSIAYDSEVAFQMASAGMECALYNDFVNNEFDLGTADEVTCFNLNSSDGVSATGNATVSGEEQLFQFSVGSPEICTRVSVRKFYHATNPVDVIVDGVTMRSTPCPAGSVCTVIQSRGYNVPCAQINTGIQVVEREYTQVY